MTAPLSIALHAEIARRAAAWMDMIARASAADRHALTGKGAADIVTWLMIANELGWSSNQTLPPVEIGGPLAVALEMADPRALPETARDWNGMLKSARSTLARLRGAADDIPAGGDRLRAMRAITRYLEDAHARFLAKHTPAQGERQEAA